MTMALRMGPSATLIALVACAGNPNVSPAPAPPPVATTTLPTPPPTAANAAPIPDALAERITMRQGATQVNGRLPPEQIQAAVRAHWRRFRRCYERGLAANPALQGRVAVKLVIFADGNVLEAGVDREGSDRIDAEFAACVLGVFNDVSFPQPEGPLVTVIFPIVFAIGEPIDRRTPSGNIVQVGPTSVGTGIHEAVVSRIIRQSVSRFDRCYGAAVPGDADQGVVAAKFKIALEGHVTSVEPMAHETTLRAREVTECVLRVFGTLSFPAPGGDAPVPVVTRVSFHRAPAQ